MPNAPVERADAGFTLLEVVVVMAVVSIVMSLGLFGFANWRDTAQHQGAADELISALRNASTTAISEGRTYCISLSDDGRSVQQWRFACSSTTGTAVTPPTAVQGGGKVTLAATVPFPTTAAMPSPTPACPAEHKCLYFYPRGTAIPAKVDVVSAARDKTLTVRVEGLTARVYR